MAIHILVYIFSIHIIRFGMTGLTVCGLCVHFLGIVNNSIKSQFNLYSHSLILNLLTY